MTSKTKKEPTRIQLSMPATAEFVSVARLTVSGVASRMNFSIDAIEDIKIAVSEACTNAVQYAYEDRTGNGNLDIICLVKPKTLEILVQDQGKGFKQKEKQKKPKQEIESLGLGLTFIQTLMDAAEVKSEVGKGTTIRMVKHLPK